MSLTRRQMMVHSAAALSAWHTPVFSQTQPGRLIYGYASGGVATQVGDALTDTLRQRHHGDWRMQYLPGNGSRAAQETVKTAAPDGQTLLYGSSTSVTLFPALYKRLNYTAQDYTPIAPLYAFPRIFAVGPRVPTAIKTIDDYIAWVQTNPSLANVGIPAIGSGAHFVVSVLSQAKNTVLRTVAYRGSSASAKDLSGGSLPAAVTMLGQSPELFASGVLRPLAVATPLRWPSLPGVPTLKEQGVEHCEVTEWHGVLAPAGMPEARTATLEAAMRDALQHPPVRDVILQLGLKPMDMGSAEFARHIAQDQAHWRDLVQRTRFSATE